MQKAMDTLELSKIIEQLRSFARTHPGKQRIVEHRPSPSLRVVRRLQEETTEAVGIIGGSIFPFDECGDLFPYLRRAEKGGILAARELMEIGNFLRALETTKNAFLKYEYARERFPLFHQYMVNLALFPSLSAQFTRTFQESGEIKENASPALSSLHGEKRSLQGKIQKCMESYLRSHHYRKYLQENVITIRNERYVLPVKLEYRNNLPGLVHDQSASGQTLFVEPLPAVELNNRLQIVNKQIDEEIERILRLLTDLVAGKADAIEGSLKIYGELDFILARGYLSLFLNARAPRLNSSGHLRIIGGRHPLLDKEKVVPIDLHLGENFTTLIITGPNTGGKTVTLKIIGLFALMTQCGLHLPAGNGTEMPVFDGIWTDIGDEQDIQQSLSTFSGHIKNIIKIVREAAPFSLVLLDEIGAGTDPSEGSALAMAILEELHQRGTRTVATTHINELKIFAHQREGMENASMEFDSVTLAPTYRLMIGVPGQSNALVIAERLGLDPALVSKANSFISKDFLDLEKIISRLAAEKQRFAESSRGIEEIKANMQATLREIEQEKSELEEKREGMLQKAREEAQSILRVARREAEAILKRLYRAESEKKKNTVDAFSLGQEIKANLKELQEELSPPDGQNDSGGGRRFSRVEELSEGQEVYINSLRSHGRIARISSAGEILVQAGTLRVETRLSDLSISIGKMNVGEKGRTRAAPASKQSQIELIHEKSTTLRPRIDLRGMTLDEAILKLDKYLDDALLTSLDTFDIIHGKGTGRLRQGVHHYLKNLSQVAAFRLGGQGEGGSGATIVQLKKS